MLLSAHDFLRSMSSVLYIHDHHLDALDITPFSDPVINEHINASPYTIAWNALQDDDNWHVRKGFQRFLDIMANKSNIVSVDLGNIDFIRSSIDYQLLIILSMHFYMG